MLLGSVARPLPSLPLTLLMTTPPPRATPPPTLTSFLTENGIAASVVSTPESTPTDTAAEAAAALGVADVSRVVKSLVFVAGNGTPLLVLASGTARVNTKALEQEIGCRVRLATPEEAEAATGHVVGSIPPLCVDCCATL